MSLLRHTANTAYSAGLPNVGFDDRSCMFSRLLPSLRVLVTFFALVASGLLLTQPAAAAPAADEPDTVAQTSTRPAAQVGAWLSGTLSSVRDRDWFRFRVTTTSTVLITLGDLPADYRLVLSGSSGRPLGTSDGTGTGFEQLQRRLPAGVYHAEVSAARGVADPARPYRLQLRTLPDQLVVLDAHQERRDGLYAIAGQLLNGTSVWRRYPRITARFYGAGDRYLGAATALAAQNYLGPGQRGHFRLIAAQPAGTVRYALSVRAPVTAPPAGAGPTISADQPYPVQGGRTRYVGRLTGGARPGQVQVVRYNRIGAFVDSGVAVLAPPVAGEPVRYQIELPTYPYLRAERTVYSPN